MKPRLKGTETPRGMMFAGKSGGLYHPLCKLVESSCSKADAIQQEICELCGRADGLFMPCSELNCRFKYHPFCASTQYGLSVPRRGGCGALIMHSSKADEKTSIRFRVFCEMHIELLYAKWDALNVIVSLPDKGNIHEIIMKTNHGGGGSRMVTKRKKGRYSSKSCSSYSTAS
jgi:hypothetical protein